MQEIIQNLLSNATALWSVFIGFLTANLATILTLVITIIRNKAKTMLTEEKLNAFLIEQKIQMNQENKEFLLAEFEKLNSKLSNATDAVYTKLKLDTDEKRKAIEENAKKVDTIIQDTLKALE